MTDFYIFTKSVWDEPPRLRHQVAELLASHGHDTLFFEKPSRARTARREIRPHLQALGTRYLMHWQLRAVAPLTALNAAVETREIRAVAAEPPRVGIVNFNYDYQFLRDIYPSSKIVTVINDDFIDGARPFARAEARRVLAATARMSDRSLAVSYPLADQLRAFTPRVDLFLPWSRSGYVQPERGRERPDLLFWGYLNDRVDAAAVMAVLEAGIRVHFVGHVTPSRKVEPLLAHPNATHRDSASLAELREIVDRCCASILPYDISFRMVAAITVNNRAFELLGFGLPLLYSDLPALIEAPPEVIYRCGSPEAFVAAAAAARATFDETQPAIRGFLAAHTPEARYAQLTSYFG